MASPESEHGISVEVIVDGRPLQEYEPPADEAVLQGVRVRYVEVDGASRFTLRCTLPKSKAQKQDEFLVEYSLDGNPKVRSGVPRGLFRHGSYALEHDRQIIYKDGQRLVALWRFSPLTVVETEHSLQKEDMEKYKGLGEIRVDVFAAHKVRRRASRDSHKDHFEIAADEIPEKCLKGRSLSSGIRLEVDPTADGRRDAYEWHRVSETPTASFIFRYRTHGDLIKSGIIERPDEHDDLQDMTVEQLRAMARNQRNQLEESKAEVIRRIKRERQVTDQEDRPAKRRATTEVVDLTGA